MAAYPPFAVQPSQPEFDEFYVSIVHWGMFGLDPKIFRDCFIGQWDQIIWLL
jgi:hypothetical protein